MGLLYFVGKESGSGVTVMTALGGGGGDYRMK
jgi:hypothetical protein